MQDILDKGKKAGNKVLVFRSENGDLQVVEEEQNICVREILLGHSVGHREYR